MLQIKNKRLMGFDGDECKNTLPTADDFKFFGGGGGKGGKGKTQVVYVPQQVKAPVKEVVKQAPNPSTQDTATNTTDTNTDTTNPTNEDEIIGGRKKSLGGTRKLTIPVTTSR